MINAVVVYIFSSEIVDISKQGIGGGFAEGRKGDRNGTGEAEYFTHDVHMLILWAKEQILTKSFFSNFGNFSVVWNLSWGFPQFLFDLHFEYYLTFKRCVCRLGQSLCMHGVNPSLFSNNTINNSVGKGSSGRKTSAESHPIIGYNMVNVGVANLPLTARTDLANRLFTLAFLCWKLFVERHLRSIYSCRSAFALQILIVMTDKEKSFCYIEVYHKTFWTWSWIIHRDGKFSWELT